MAFERPLTVMEALREIDRNRYALPALQREFVWKPAQISELFDSIMKGYPIGSFLFWKLEEATARAFQFYQFMRDYHQKDRPFCDEFPVQTAGPEIAVLDGQQRLTAFNIAIYGSYAEKKKYLRRDSARAYPTKRFYLNLLHDPDAEEGSDYDFRFLTDHESKRRDEQTFWFRVGKMTEFEDYYQVPAYLAAQGLENHQMGLASKALGKLHRMLFVTPIISYFQEQDQDLDKVLNIFIRVNSGGTQLGYADLLLSMATAQWKNIDARQEINNLVTELNSYGGEDRFNFSKDFILKAGMTLTGQSNIKFTAANFTANNMRAIEDAWSRIANALNLAVQLLDDFGMGRRHARATSAVIVIAAYLYFKGYDERFLDRAINANERAEIKRWFTQMNLSNIWAASFADTLLPRVIGEFERLGTFDCNALLDLTRKLGRDPYLDSDRIDELLELHYSNSQTFLVLSMLLDSIQAHTARAEVDHIYPRSMTHKKKMEEMGFSEEEIDHIKDRINRLPNLWLLSNTTNQEKSNKMPLVWMDSLNEETREYFIKLHHLQDLVEDFEDFEDFYEARKERLRPLLMAAFGLPQAQDDGGGDLEIPEPLEGGLSEVSKPFIVKGTVWSEDTLAILEETYHPLAQVLMAAGVPEPEDVDREILGDNELTTSRRSIMNWAGEKPILLIEPNTPHEGLDAQVVLMNEEDLEQVATSLKHMLS